MDSSAQLLSNWWLDALLGVIVTYAAMNLGKVLLAYRNDYQPVASFFQPEASTGFNAIYQILFAPICTVFAAIVFYLLGWNQFVVGIWTVPVWYFIWQTSLIIGISRWRLLDKWKYFIFHAISVALTYYVYSTLIKNGLKHLLPDEANLRTEVWLIVALFLYGIFREIKGNHDRYERRQAAWAQAHARTFSKKYRTILANYPILFQEVLLALMIYEDFNRPKMTRLVERIINARTQTIMQVRGAHTDEEGIRATAVSMESGFPAFEIGIAGKKYDFQQPLSEMISVHNADDPNYSWRVIQIFSDIHNALPLSTNIEH
jgi:hypothetical protein